MNQVRCGGNGLGSEIGAHSPPKSEPAWRWENGVVLEAVGRPVFDGYANRNRKRVNRYAIRDRVPTPPEPGSYATRSRNTRASG